MCGIPNVLLVSPPSRENLPVLHVFYCHKKKMRQGRAVILLVIRHYYYDKRDTRPAVRYCDRLMMLVWYSETEKGRSTAKSLLQLPRPVITSVNPQLVISSTGRRFFFLLSGPYNFILHTSVHTEQMGLSSFLYANYRIRLRIDVRLP